MKDELAKYLNAETDKLKAAQKEYNLVMSEDAPEGFTKEAFKKFVKGLQEVDLDEEVEQNIKVANACQCTICGATAHLLTCGLYCCVNNVNHQGDTNTGIFSDLTPPKPQAETLPNPLSAWGKKMKEKIDKWKGKG